LSDLIKNLKFPIFIILILVLSFNTCREKEKESFASLNSIEKIKKRGKLVAVMDYNSTNYFIYRGEPMGYQYELLQILADELDVKLEVKVENDIDKNFEMLKSGDCDIIGINLTVTKERTKTIDFTYPHSQTHQVLVQRKPENWRSLSKNQLEANLLRNQLNLGGKVIYVQKGTSYEQRMMNLSDEIGDSIKLISKSDKEVEELIELVARGEIEYTVADENIALVNQIYYPILDVKTAVSFPQNLAWGLKKGDNLFKAEIDTWLKEFRKSTKYAVIYNKYFRSSRSLHIVESDFYAKNSGKVSGYDDYIRKYSKKVDWDWRLLASLIYQESRFKSNVKSWAGAYGLMQLMPTTAKRFGVNRKSAPEKHIKAGVDFIKWLDTRFVKRGISDDDERIKFVLASYNVGLGHVLDARRLAVKNGKDPNVWEKNVDEYILLKSNPQYYKDPVVKYGYCRGSETYNYVIEIIDRFEQYKNTIPET